jgi:hypothetical protein
VAGSFASYLALGAAGCTVGGVTVRDFVVPFIGGLTEPFLGEVILTPFLRAEGPGTFVGFSLGFSPALAVSATYSLGGGEGRGQGVGVGFTAQAGPGTLIGGVGVSDLAGTASASRPRDFFVGGAASVVGEAALTATGPNRFVGVFAQRTDACSVAPSQCGGDVRRDFGANVGVPAGSVALRATARVGAPGPGQLPSQLPITFDASLSSYTGGIYVAPVAVFVPEPSTLALAGVGGLALIGASVVRRRRQSAE